MQVQTTGVVLPWMEENEQEVRVVLVWWTATSSVQIPSQCFNLFISPIYFQDGVFGLLIIEKNIFSNSI